MKKILLGIGNRLRQDDGAGSILAERLKDSQWMTIDGADIPENFTGIIKREKPDLLVLVDATDLDENPGTLRRVPVDHLSDETGFNTHSGPLTFLITHLKKHSGDIIFVGIQPLSVGFGEELSEPVEDALDELEDLLRKDHLEDIPLIEFDYFE